MSLSSIQPTGTTVAEIWKWQAELQAKKYPGSTSIHHPFTRSRKTSARKAENHKHNLQQRAIINRASRGTKQTWHGIGRHAGVGK